MAASNWHVYNSARKALGTSGWDFSSDALRIHYFISGANVSDATLSSYGSLTGELTAANGYSKAGKSLASITWSAGDSARQIMLSASDNEWTATGGAWSSILYAVLTRSASGAILAWSKLSSSAFDVTDGKTIKTQFTNGIFDLTGGN